MALRVGIPRHLGQDCEDARRAKHCFLPTAHPARLPAAFSNGIITLFLVALALLLVTDADVDKLVALYACSASGPRSLRNSNAPPDMPPPPPTPKLTPCQDIPPPSRTTPSSAIC